MCLLTVLPPNTDLTYDQWGNAFDYNQDGWGIAYASDGKLLTTKRLTDFTDFYATLQDTKAEHNDKNILVHLRMTTHGACDLENTHPFYVNDNLLVAHNGIINTPELVTGRSDTWHYVENRLKPLLAANPYFLYCPLTTADIAKEIGYSKLAFLDNDGDYKIINEKLGTWMDGAWVSAPQYLEKWTPIKDYTYRSSSPLDDIYLSYEDARDYLLRNPDRALDYIYDLQEELGRGYHTNWRVA